MLLYSEYFARSFMQFFIASGSSVGLWFTLIYEYLLRSSISTRDFSDFLVLLLTGFHYSSDSKGIMSSSNTSKMWLVASNFITSAAWGRVAFLIALYGLNEESASCSDVIVPATRLALGISFVEVLNCILGLTRSPILAVLLFSCTRAGVELLVAPLIPCESWQHLLTVSMWGIGDLVRFGCFTVDTAKPGIRAVKSIRFTVGPILFPIGAFGEMMMVILAASDGRPALYVAAALWPVSFYPMMQQLLKQRRKHFYPKDKKKEIKAV